MKLNKIFRRPKWLGVSLIITVGSLIYIILGSDLSFSKKNDYDRQIQHLQAKIKNNQDSTAIFNEKIRNLQLDDEQLEKVAREVYGMKRSHEDVYLIDIK